MGFREWLRARRVAGVGGQDEGGSAARVTQPVGAALATRLKADPALGGAGGSGRSDDVGAVWVVGERVAGLYDVLEVYEQGGMGLVYRVRHVGWDVELAVKAPRPEQLQGEVDRQRFVSEAETWVSLGLHPHVCSCYYVRALGGVPRVFAEYVAGGSLRDWIEDGRLYAGSAGDALARIVDLAIQTAWGLAYAHDLGVVHQDVKPANVLVDVDGTAKVTDFGLARAGKLGSTGQPAGASGATVLVTVGGMTVAYASPEQVTGGSVGRRSDVWSFAVSVLEMFTGGVSWLSGPAAGAALEGYRNSAEGLRVVLPDSVAEVLAECLQNDPADRLASMEDVAGRLVEVYGREVGCVYARVRPDAAQLRADQLNNRALSLLDLDRRAEAEAAFVEARAVDPQHLEAIYNHGLLRWRAAEITDDELVSEIEAVLAASAGSWQVKHLLAQVHLERGAPDEALPLLEDAAAQAPDDGEVAVALGVAREAAEGLVAPYTLDGHVANVSVTYLSYDGEIALSRSSDGEVRVWQVSTGRCPRVHDVGEDVQAVALSGNGQVVITGHNDGGVRLWDAVTGRPQGDLVGHTDRIMSVCLSTNGRFAAAGSSDERKYNGSVRIWDVRTGGHVQTIEDHRSSVFASLSLSADGRVLLTGDKTLARVWDVEAGRVLHHLGDPRSADGYTPRMSADGRRGLSWSADGASVWDLATGSCERSFAGPVGSMSSIDVSADGRRGIDGGFLGAGVRIWDLDSGRCLRTRKGPWGDLSGDSVRLSGDGRRALVCQGATVWVWPVPGPSVVAAYQPCRPRSHTELAALDTAAERMLAEAAGAIGEGRYAAALRSVSEVRAFPNWQRASGALEAWRRLAPFSVRTGVRSAWHLKTLAERSGDADGVVVTPDGRTVLAWGMSGSTPKPIVVWDVEAGQQVGALEVDKGTVHCAAVSADGQMLATGLSDGSIRLWDLDSSQCRASFGGHVAGVESIGLTGDARRVVSAGSDGVKVWDVATGRCLRVIVDDLGAMTSVSLSAGGQVLLTQARSERDENRRYRCAVRVWDVATGRRLHTLLSAEGSSVSSLSPDGRIALTREDGTTVRVWDVQTGRSLSVLTGHTEPVTSISLAPDGRLVYTGSADRTLRVWEVRTGRCLRVIEPHIGSGSIASLGVSADGRIAVFLNPEYIDRDPYFVGTLRVWEIDWELEARDPADWDDGARPQLATFLTVHTPLALDVPEHGELPEEQIRLALTRHGRPSWSEREFEGLLRQLQYSGYGWLRPDGVRAQLDRMTQDWQGPPLPA